MSAIRRRQITVLRLLPLTVIAGCVSLYIPLEPDEGYPADWPPIARLSPECKVMTGDYDNAGTLALASGGTQPVLLTSVLGLSGPANVLSLTVATGKLDKYGDSSATLEVVPDRNPAARHELTECFCVKQTLMCKVTESYRVVPYLSIGGSQRNVYFSVSQDGGLITKLQDYHIDLVLVLPIYGKSEPWARFIRIAR